jgi:hypothetical protein
MMRKRRIDVNLDELDQIIDRSTRAPLSESEGQKLKTALHAMAERLVRKRNTEKISAVLPGAAQAGKPETGESAPAGHGRNGAAAFSGANKVTVAHATLHSGDLCPECLRGKARTDAASASGSATARCRQSRSGSPAGVAPICSFAKWPSMTFSAALMRTNRKFLIEKCEADGRGSD